MTNSINDWSYPFASGADSPLANLTNLARAKGGYYPMGANGLWHGGVHFDQGTGAAFDQSSVRCIADGEVIAYRIDSQYPASEYTGDIPRIKRAPFSTGFVLVRHRLALPPLGTSTGPTLAFYSLYMHLQDWAGYNAQASLLRPAFWCDGTYRVETQGSDLNARAEAHPRSTILAALPNGTEVRIDAGDGELRKLLSIVNGSTTPQLAPVEGVETLPGYLAIRYLKAQHEPRAKDEVVVLDTPIRIKAGELIGHLGQYQNHSDNAPQPLLHLEVFSCEDVPAFIASSRAHAARLPDEHKTLLKIHKGASKLVPHRPGIDSNNPPSINDEGMVIGVDLIVPQSLLDGLPADAKLIAPARKGDRSCSPEVRWWRLDDLLADQDGNPISGWLAEQEMITTRHSPWEWESYTCIEDGEPSASTLAYHLEALRRLNDDERASYQGVIDLSDKGPIKQRLHAVLDGNGDKKITSKEIRAAMAKPWQAQSIAQLITRHESEWLWNPNKWDELDELMDHSPASPNPNWLEEKKRIEKLSWWEKLGSGCGLTPDGVAWHFNPVRLILQHSTPTKLLVSREQLSQIMVSASDELIDKYLIPINDAMKTFDITTHFRIGHFLAQVAHETGELKFSEEISSGTQYEGRRDLGNFQAGDGTKFKGRGLLQLTGRSNYEQCEAFLRTMEKYSTLDITSSNNKASQLASDPNLSALASGYYWSKLKPKLNAAADKNDLFWVSVYINGWKPQSKPYYPNREREPNNMAHRAEMTERAFKVLGIRQ
ncbi:hypothetical protein [Pseudomonas sp. Q2-TVG4-2]|uniref:glycoside hydrolase family 19 protein n=1 Tax=Pseudomonas sp. Q2-TVG4-2 TaxID=1685699 RepID=UPI0015E6A62E|nr:hypothetical protein [Pseudomonas sp. Q2-TVG4-2]